MKNATARLLYGAWLRSDRELASTQLQTFGKNPNGLTSQHRVKNKGEQTRQLWNPQKVPTSGRKRLRPPSPRNTVVTWGISCQVLLTLQNVWYLVYTHTHLVSAASITLFHLPSHVSSSLLGSFNLPHEDQLESIQAQTFCPVGKPVLFATDAFTIASPKSEILAVPCPSKRTFGLFTSR